MAMVEQEYTLAEMAALVGVSYRTIYAWHTIGIAGIKLTPSRRVGASPRFTVPIYDAWQKQVDAVRRRPNKVKSRTGSNRG